jgi:hypothetical protein
MNKFLLFALFLLSFCFSSHAEFGISSSAVCLNVNGSLGFYNTQSSSATNSIGKLNFSGNLGTFGANSGNLKIIGAGINTFKTNGANVCSGTLYYLVYRQGNRPTSPDFSSITLGFYSGTNTNQQWQDVSNAIDLTAFGIGNYTLEIYYVASGEQSISENCSQQKLDNVGGADYVADFSIAIPLAVNFSSLYAIAYDETIGIKWVMQNDVHAVTYEIQKSDNGLNFTTIGKINSRQTTGSNNYSFMDEAPFLGTNYYRLKVSNDNGTISLSNVIRIYFAIGGNGILIYPNPSGNVLIAQLAGVNKGSYQLSVLNSGGQKVVSMPLAQDGLDKTLHINLPVTLPKGLYWLFLIDETQFYKQSFLVK